MNCIVIFLLLPLLLDKFHICKDPRKVNKDEDEDEDNVFAAVLPSVEPTDHISDDSEIFILSGEY